jgi:hypothetical protein
LQLNLESLRDVQLFANAVTIEEIAPNMRLATFHLSRSPGSSVRLSPKLDRNVNFIATK